MIELMLQAERALIHGMVDEAERIYRGAIERDPKNSIAVVGLARVALERGDDRRALEMAREALTIDPENVAARRLAVRMAEVLRYRGEAVGDGPEAIPSGPEVHAAGGERPAAPSRPEDAHGRPAARARGLLDRFRKRE